LKDRRAKKRKPWKKARAAAATGTDRAVIAIVIVGGAIAFSGCGSSEQHSERGSLRAYVARVEPIRLCVNRLLGGADPILSAFQEHRLGPRAAQRRFDRLERRFAAYAERIAALRGAPVGLRSAQRSYAHTYVLEDAYLGALAAALPEREFDNLPETQSIQRAAIIAWRIQLEVVAERLGVRLPSDIQAAGRGEIAPAPSGS
jgi:hypothetical protein